MEKQTTFVELLFNDLIKNVRTHIKIKSNEKGGYLWSSGNYMNKDHGKTALKRKITTIRQELLNLEKMLDD